MVSRFINTIFFCIVLLTSIKTTHAQWYPQNSNSTAFLTSVFFTNQTTGWACGFETVLKTTDCGSTWTSAFLLGFHRSIFFLNESNGWICGDGGKLYRTTNSGASWELINLGITTTLNQISFLNENLGMIVCNNGIVLKSTNNGVNWYNLNVNSILNLYSVKILDNNIALVSGNESSMYKTTNSGISWEAITFGMPNPLLTIEFINESTGWVSGCCGMFLRTTNSGLNWTPEVYLTPGYSIYSMKFINETTGWAAGNAGYILKTTNGGNNWDSLNSSTHSDLYCVYFLNKDTGITVGHGGTILKTTNGGGTGFPIKVNQLSNEIPPGFFLFQNFPNPFNPKTIINYNIPNAKGQQSKVKLIIFNSLGREIETLIEENQNPGSYSVEWDASKYPSGIYYYRIAVHSDKLESQNYSETKKMILIK